MHVHGLVGEPIQQAAVAELCAVGRTQVRQQRRDGRPPRWLISSGSPR
jgi:hypothetical protein